MAVNQIISNFLTTAAVKDFSRDNLYRVMSLKTRALELDQTDLLYCKGAKIPGRSTPVAQVQYHGMKINYNKSTVQYPSSDNYSLTFYLDANGDLRKKFEQASRIIFNDISNTGNWRVPGANDILTIAQLGFDMQPIKYYHLYGVTIVSINEYDGKAADGSGEIVQVTLNLSYNYYRTSGSQVIYSE